MDERERNDVERLNRLWDAALDRGPAEPDCDLAEAVSSLHAIDDAPEPDPVFLARLRNELLVVREPASVRAPTGAQPLGLVWPAPVTLPRPIARLAIAAIAAALLVAALSGGGRWLSGSGPAPMVASAMASTFPNRPTAVSTSIQSPVEGEVPSVSTGFHPTAVPGLAVGASVDFLRIPTR
jgi:hypothetical protein